MEPTNQNQQYQQQYQQPYQQPQQPQQVQYTYQQPQIPPEYAPISMWGYFGYQLLFAIPCVGFVMLIIYALSATNVNLKNFARSYFCVMIIGIILSVIFFALAGATMASIMNELY